MCSSAFPSSVPKEFPFAAPRAAVCCLPASSSSLPLSVIANEGGVSLSFLSLTTSRRNLGCSSSETGADLRANTCVPTANPRGFEPCAAEQQENQNNRRGTGESDGDGRAGYAELPEGPRGQPFPRHLCLSRAPGIPAIGTLQPCGTRQMSQAPRTTICGLLSAGRFNGILEIEANPLPTLQDEGGGNRRGAALRLDLSI